MRPALLLVGHGTRSAAGASEFTAFVERVRARAGDLPVAGGFIELAPPPLTDAVAGLVRQGHRHLVAVPLVLVSAGHAKGDVPAALARERRRHPGTSYSYGRPLGPHPTLLALLEERLDAVLDRSERAGTAVLLVGRGSTDPDANADVHKLARLFWEGRDQRPDRGGGQGGLAFVETAFVSLARPDVAEGLERCRRLGARRVVVLPYFLFSGVLPERVAAQVSGYAAAHPELDVRRAGLIGGCDALADLVLERYEEAIVGDVRMNCDTCVYRVALPGFEHRVGAPQIPHDHPHDPAHAHAHGHRHDPDHPSGTRPGGDLPGGGLPDGPGTDALDPATGRSGTFAWYESRPDRGGDVDLRHHGDAEVEPGLVDLAVNVRPDTPPAWLAERLHAALPGVAAYPDPCHARTAVAGRHGRDPDEALLTAGGAEAFALLARALRPRRAVIVHPQFTEPEAALRAAGHPVDRVVLSGDFVLDPGDVPDDADLVVIGNPTNPTSVLHPARTLTVLARPGRVLVVDEAFSDCVPGEPESLAGRRDVPGLVVVRSLTKTWGLAGVRAGYVLADPAILAALAETQPLWPVSTLALAAARACCEPRAIAEADAWARALATERDHLAGALAALPGVHVVPGAQASFLCVRVPEGHAVRTGLRDTGFVVRRGDTFPGLGPDWLRVAVRDRATSEAFVAAFRKVLESGSRAG